MKGSVYLSFMPVFSAMGEVSILKLIANSGRPWMPQVYNFYLHKL